MRLDAVNFPPLVAGLAEATSVNYHLDRERRWLAFIGPSLVRSAPYEIDELGRVVMRRRRANGNGSEEVRDLSDIAGVLCDLAERVR